MIIGQLNVAPNENWTGWSKEDGTEAQIVCKQGQQVWNFITQNKASEVSKNMYSSELTFTSDLMNSYAWDTAIVFIQTFGAEENSSTYACQSATLYYDSEPKKTAMNILESTNKVDMQCNIFDMAGNAWEWSTETHISSDLPCGLRSCEYGYDYTCTRYGLFKDYAYYTSSFRPILYL